jgi:hypothetical protein
MLRMMEPPRKYLLVLEEIHDLEHLITLTQQGLNEYPTEFSLQLSLRQAQSRKERLLRELYASLEIEQRTVTD